MKRTGWRPLPVSWNNPAESPLWKLASTLTAIGLARLKYAIVLSLVMLAFSFSNASVSSAPHLNFVPSWDSFHKGAVSDAYLGINCDRYRLSTLENLML